MSWQNDPVAPAGSAPWGNDPVVAPSPRDVLGVAAKVNPDHAAEAERLAKRYPAPSDVLLRNLQDAQFQAAVDDADAKLSTNVPALRRKMTDVSFARQAHDDVDPLTKLEGVFRQTGRSAKSGVFGASRGAAGVFRAVSEFAAPTLDWLEPDDTTFDWRRSIGGNPLRRLAEGFALSAQQNADQQQSLRPQGPQGVVAGGFYSGVESLTQNMITLPMAFLPGGQGAALSSMVSFTGGNSYEDARNKGLSMQQALPFAASQAAIEYATEKIPLVRLLSDVKAGTPILQTLMRQVAAEVPGEQVATILQDLNEWAALNPDKPFTSYLEERPSAAAQTLIATIVGAGGNVTVAKAIEGAANLAVRRDMEVVKSDEALQRFEAALAAAAESKLRERSPETFAQFVQQAAEEAGGAPTAVYVDARALTDALNQAGIPDDQLAQIMPSVSRQIADAFEAGGVVEIPIGEALAAVPGTPLEQVLLQNARMEPDGLSRVEVDEAGKQADQFVKSEAERIMQQATERAEHDRQVDEIRTSITEQVNATKRFRPDVGSAYATMVGAFYSTMAKRAGVTPAELYAKFPLRVTGEMRAGAALEQAGTPEFNAWFGDSKVVDAEGKPLVVYHGTEKSGFDVFDPARAGENTGRDFSGIYFTNHKLGAETYSGTKREANPSPEFDAEYDAEPGNYPVYLKMENPYFIDFEEQGWDAEIGGFFGMDEVVAYAQNAGFDGVVAENVSDEGRHGQGYGWGDKTFVVFKPEQIKSATKNDGSYDANDPSILSQPGTRATFSPSQMLIALGPKADYSSFLHESGHFFLEVMSDLASQSGAPEQIVRDWQATLDWFGIKGEKLALVEQDQENSAPVGSWVRLPYPDSRGTPIAQVREVALADLYLPELNEKGELQPEKRSYLEGYTERAKAGEQAPNISVVEMEDGRLRVVDGHRRVMAARAAGQTTLRATVSPLMDSPDGKVPMVAEALAKTPTEVWAAMTLEQKRPYHERWAESVEQYFFEGKAPSVELRGVFDRFRTWLVSVYKSIKQFLASRTATPGGQAASGELAQSAPAVVFDDELMAQAVKDSSKVGGFIAHALETDVQGVIPGKPRELDRMLAKGSITEQQLRDTWAGTRDMLRQRYGDRMVLYRSDAPASRRSSESRTVYMADQETAGMYASSERQAKAYTVPIDDILAVYARPSGYFEVIVKIPAGGLDANGELAQGAPGTPAFDKWFGGSKVVNSKGEPLVVYHGTGGDFDTFSEDADAAHWKMSGFYFAPNAEDANRFAESAAKIKQNKLGNPFRPDGANVMPVYLSLQNPKVIEFSRRGSGGFVTPQEMQEMLDEAKFDGHDGAIIKGWQDGSGEVQYVAFRPEQIKSATGNRGTYDPNILNQSAYHGTPHRGIGKFSTDKIGTGEGAQAYGWGLYFASKREIAEWYRQVLGGVRAEFKPKGGNVSKWWEQAKTLYPGDTAKQEAWHALAQKDDWSDPAAVAAWGKEMAYSDAARDAVDSVIKDIYNPGQLYKVEIPEDSEMLLWDKPLSEQPEAVRKALESMPGMAERAAKMNAEDDDLLAALGVDAAPAGSLPLMNGRELYETLTKEMSAAVRQRVRDGEFVQDTHSAAQKAASEALAALGVKGIKYLDGTSRGAGDGSYNYVVFSGDDVAITEQFYQRDQSAGPLGLTDEIRAVMDRLLATDEQIAEMERVRQYGLLFKSPEDAGMTPEQWAKYTSDDEKAHAEALNELGRKSLKNMALITRKRMQALKAVQADIAEKRKAVEAEAAEIIAKEPVYQAMRWLKKGEMVTPDGEEIKAANGFKLDRASVDAIFPESMAGRPDLAKLKGMMIKSGGLHADIVAEMFGFRDGAHLITTIAEAFPQQDQVDGLTDQMMLERYGDAATPRGMERAADEAVHNENRARVLAAEMAAVSQANNARMQTASGRTVNAMVAAAKQFAETLAGRTKVRDVNPAKHTAAETRAARAAEKALAKGDTQAVIQAKRDQLLNFHMARAMNEARLEVAKIEAFFKKVGTAKDDVVGKTRDIDVVKAAQAILAAYGMTTEAKGKAAAEYLSVLEKNDPAMFAAVKPSIEAALINAKPTEQLTLDELRALNEEVQALWYLAKRSRQMEIDGNLLDRQEIEDDLKARLVDIGIPDTMPGDTSAITPAEQRALKLKGYLAAARRVESWVRGMDGSKGIGPFRRFVWQPVKEAADRYRADKAKHLKAFRDLLAPIAPTLTKRTIDAPELGYTFGEDTDGVAMAEILHAILHTGNESNKRKLLLGREIKKGPDAGKKWATENPDGTLDTSRWDAFIKRMVADGTLQPAHFDFVQGVWDLLEQTKPLAQKAHRDVFGRYFAEVTADEFTDPFGVKRRGGYVPAMADPRIVSDAATRALAEAENASMSFAFPTTNKGFTKGRVEYNRPLMLDLRSIAQHIDKVLLFSHMEQPVREVRKVLTAKGVAYGLNRIDPVAFDHTITPWLNRAAKQIVADPVPHSWQGWKFWTTIRNRAGMAAMFGNVANAVQQVAGFSLAAVRVKPSLLLQATAQFVANPKQTAEMVSAKSVYMKGRLENEVANMNDAINDILLDPNTYQKTKAFVGKHAYFLQSAVDSVMGPVIWTGAYNQALAEGMEERDAIRQADSAVRETQGSTTPEDISAIESGTPFSRLFTQFAGYFNMQANLLGTEFQTLAREMGLRKGMGRGLYVLTFGFLVNAWVAEAIMQLFKGGPDDEDKDGEFLDDWLKQVFGWSLFRNATAMVPVFGQLATGAVNATNDKPYDDRIATSPAISMIETSLKAPFKAYKAVAEDGDVGRAIKDVATLIAMTVGIPVGPVAKPLAYAADVDAGKVAPTSEVDAVRGAITGSAGGEAKKR